MLAVVCVEVVEKSFWSVGAEKVSLGSSEGGSAVGFAKFWQVRVLALAFAAI
jgi:hypothetical protein